MDQSDNSINRPGKGLIFKIGVILLILLFVKLLMISVGIYTAKNMKGDARAINLAGSERMRSYKISFLINEWLKQPEGEKKNKLEARILSEVQLFENILKNLTEGDGPGKKSRNRYEEPFLIAMFIDIFPSSYYILGLPGVYEPDLKAQIVKVNEEWADRMAPLIKEIIKGGRQGVNLEKIEELHALLPQFVTEVDNFVSNLEDSFDRKVSLFTSLQYLFLFMTILITAVALDHIFLHTKRSVDALMIGIRAITSGTFFKRVEVITDDEMGELASGFNYMAEKLEELYGNLENRVREKTVALEDRNRTLSILYDTVASLKESLPIEDLLNNYLLKLQGALNISGGAIRLYEEDNSLRFVASFGLDECVKDNISLGAYSPAYENNGSKFEDGVMLLGKNNTLQEGCEEIKFKTVAEIPISYQDKKLGILNLFKIEVSELSAQEKMLIDTLNNHVAATIEYYALNNKTKKLAIMEERNMLASELHDSIAQTLAYLKIQANLLEESLLSGKSAQALEDLTQMRRGIEESNKNVRELLVHFRTKIDMEGLETTIKKFLVRFNKESGIKTDLKILSHIPALSPDTEIHVLHIIQEALANARKYSGASMVKITLGGEGSFGVSVEDNGKGFNLDDVKKGAASHVGIDIMMERALRLGGTLLIKSKPGKGTTVRLELT